MATSGISSPPNLSSGPTGIEARGCHMLGKCFPTQVHAVPPNCQFPSYPSAFPIRALQLGKPGPPSSSPLSSVLFLDPGAGLPGPVHAVALQAWSQDQPGPQAQVHPHSGICRQCGRDLEEGMVGIQPQETLSLPSTAQDSERSRCLQESRVSPTL